MISTWRSILVFSIKAVKYYSINNNPKTQFRIQFLSDIYLKIEILFNIQRRGKISNRSKLTAHCKLQFSLSLCVNIILLFFFLSFQNIRDSFHILRNWHSEHFIFPWLWTNGRVRGTCLKRIFPLKILAWMWIFH